MIKTEEDGFISVFGSDGFRGDIITHKGKKMIHRGGY